MSGFRAWNTEVVKKLKAGSIKSIVFYGDSDEPRPAAPYVVVKPLAGDGVKWLSIFAHYKQGQEDELEGYILEELPALLKGELRAGGNSGDRTVIVDARRYNIGLAVSEDLTISGSRDFYIPIIL